MKSFICTLTLILAAGPLAASEPAAAAEQERARAELAHSRSELERARAELNATSARIAELSMRIAREDIEAAMARPAFERPVVGLILGSDPEAGARVAGVTPKGPAERAGLRSGDRLLTIDGTSIGTGDAQQRLRRTSELLGSLKDGQTLRIELQRRDQRQQIEVTAERLPGLSWWRDGDFDTDALRAQLAPMVAMRGLLPLERLASGNPCTGDGPCGEAELLDRLRWRGLRLAPIEPRLGRYFGTDRGVLVLSAEGSALSGVEAGDVLLEVAGEATDAPGDVLRALRHRTVGEPVAVSLLRDRKRRDLQLEAAALPHFPDMAPPAPPAPPAAPRPPMPAPAPPPPPEPAPSRGVLDRVLHF